MSSSTKPTKQCVQRLQREYKQIMKVVEEREERRRVRQAQQLQDDADREQNLFSLDDKQKQQQQQQHASVLSSPSSNNNNNNSGVPTATVSDELLFTAAPDPDNILRWYFLFESPPQEPLYAHGKYMGEFVFPSDYPFKPPKIFLLTPNGRFATGKEICLSNSSYHPESWSPAWSIETVLLGMISFFYSEEHTTGAIDRNGPKAQMVAEKKKRAKESKSYNVNELKHIYRRVFPEEYARDVAVMEEEEEEAKQQQQLQQQQQKGTHTTATSSSLHQQQQQQAITHSHHNTTENNNHLNNHVDNNADEAAAQQQQQQLQQQKRSNHPHWSTLIFLLIAVLVTVRIVIF